MHIALINQRNFKEHINKAIKFIINNINLMSLSPSGRIKTRKWQQNSSYCFNYCVFTYIEYQANSLCSRGQKRNVTRNMDRI